MEISTEWTPQERLDVIKRTSEKLQSALRKNNSKDIFHLTESINLLSRMPASFLEANRNQLLEVFD